MNKYEKEQIKKLKKWKKKVAKKPFIIDKVSKSTQNKINSMLPDKYHEVMTLAIKNMILECEKIVKNGLVQRLKDALKEDFIPKF